MRLVYGIVALLLWLGFLGQICPNLSDEVAMITGAIVAAGAMAGGA